eukprot:1400434-Rhodomonas_salina.1
MPPKSNDFPGHLFRFMRRADPATSETVTFELRRHSRSPEHHRIRVHVYPGTQGGIPPTREPWFGIPNSYPTPRVPGYPGTVTREP